MKFGNEEEKARANAQKNRWNKPHSTKRKRTMVQQTLFWLLNISIFQKGIGCIFFRGMIIGVEFILFVIELIVVSLV
jgi:hypothetical protein